MSPNYVELMNSISIVQNLLKVQQFYMLIINIIETLYVQLVSLHGIKWIRKEITIYMFDDQQKLYRTRLSFWDVTCRSCINTGTHSSDGEEEITSKSEYKQP